MISYKKRQAAERMWKAVCQSMFEKCFGQPTRNQRKRRSVSMSGMKNISKAEVMVLKDQVAYQEGQVVSRTLAQNEHVSVTLFSFDKGEEISTHESGGDAFVTCLDGVGKVAIDGVEYILHEGDSIVMPAKHPHAVYGEEQFKMLLVVIF